jgi:hypothetical protein
MFSGSNFGFRCNLDTSTAAKEFCRQYSVDLAEACIGRHSQIDGSLKILSAPIRPKLAPTNQRARPDTDD